MSRQPLRRTIVHLALQELVVGVAVSLLLVAAFIALGRLVAGGMLAVDQAVSLALHRLASPPLTAAMRLITELGAAVVAVPLLGLTVGVLLARRRRGLAVLVAVSWLGSWAIDTLTKLVFARARPSLFEPLASAASYSFPSGHTLSAVISFGLLAYLLARRRSPWVRAALVLGAVVLMVLVAVSRIYLGVHYFTDVLGSFIIGSAWLLVSVLALRRVETRDR